MKRKWIIFAMLLIIPAVLFSASCAKKAVMTEPSVTDTSAADEAARQAEMDDALRPNQLLAVTLCAIKDQTIQRNIVGACHELLIPGAIRSLADRPVQCSLPIVHHGTVLHDPN